MKSLSIHWIYYLQAHKYKTSLYGCNVTSCIIIISLCRPTAGQRPLLLVDDSNIQSIKYIGKCVLAERV